MTKDEIRARLVELIEESRISDKGGSIRINGSEDIANHLVANGVTFVKKADNPKRQNSEIIVKNL